MKRRAAIRRMQRRATRGHPAWWVMAGLVVGVGGTAAALWRSADDEPRTLFGTRVPAYLGLGRPVASAPAMAPVSSAPPSPSSLPPAK